MSARIELDDTVHAGLRQSARAHLDDAIEAAADPDLDEAIHEVRKALKKTRAIIRLARFSLGEDAYQRENRACRDIARRVSHARDTQARIETLDALVDAFEGPLDDAPFPAVRAALEAEHAAALADVHEGEVMARIDDELRAVRARVDDWPLAGDGFSCIAEGLGKVYRRGHDARRAAYDDPRPDRFHEWRKRAKYLRYQLDALSEAWPRMIERWEDELHTLTDLLGDAHDLVVLDDALEALDDVDRAERLAVRGLADTRRRRLEDEARPLGAKLYADPPPVLVERIGTWWRAARRGRRVDREG